MKKILAILVFIIFLPTLILAVRYPFPYFPLPEYSPAATVGTLAILQNPAALMENTDLELMYLHSFTDETFSGDNTVLLAREGSGFAYQNFRLSASPSINAYTFAVARRIAKSFYFGSSYTFYKSEAGDPYHNDHFWNVGITYRNLKNNSLSLIVKNLRRMEFDGDATEIEYTLAMGIRPLPDRLTVAADWNWSESQSIKEGFFKAYVHARFTRGWGMYGSLDEDGAFGFGLNFSFGFNQFGTSQKYNKDGKYQSGLIYTGYSYRPRGWILPSKKKVLKLKLNSYYPETDQQDYFWQSKRLTFFKLVEGLSRAIDDDNIGGLAVEINSPRLGWSQLEELRKLFLSFRKKNKPIYVYLGNLSGNGSYYLASAADQIAMRRVDALALTGLLAEVTYYTGTLDKLGINADLEHAGKYKAASDIVTQDSITEWHKEAINALLDDIYAVISVEMAQGRGISQDSMMALIDMGPFVPDDAVAYGLIDTILYQDQYSDWIKEKFDGAGSFDFQDYSQRKPYDYTWGDPFQIAILSVEGALTRGNSGEDLLFGKTVGYRNLQSAIKYCANNKNIKAVVLRLNTPGGEGLASDQLHHQLQDLRKHKPVVVSMSNVAASAGYHLASLGDYVYCDKTTVTGSIGVVYGKLDLSGLREKIGLKTYHFKRGKNADYFSTSVGFNPEQREKMNYQLDLLYNDFVNTVAENRELSAQYVDSIAQGRVWSGLRAKELNLVDDYGGLHEALIKARQLSGLIYEDVDFIELPKRSVSIFSAWMGAANILKTLYSQLVTSHSVDDNNPYFSNQIFSYILPYLIKIY